MINKISFNFDSSNVKLLNMQMCCAQSRLEECLKQQETIQLALGVTKKETEKEKKRNERERREWQQEREAMKEEISELRGNMKENCETLRKMEGKHKVHAGRTTTTMFLSGCFSF